MSAEEVVLPGCPEIVWDGPFPLRCSKGGTGGICSTHGRFSEPAPEPWRFDVPEVPDSVTCLKGRYGNVWVLAADGYWNLWSTLLGKVTAGWRPFEALLEEAPLVEHPDPRSTT